MAFTNARAMGTCERKSGESVCLCVCVCVCVYVSERERERKCGGCGCGRVGRDEGVYGCVFLQLLWELSNGFY